MPDATDVRLKPNKTLAPFPHGFFIGFPGGVLGDSFPEPQVLVFGRDHSVVPGIVLWEG
jgi:hypothetical protein